MASCTLSSSSCSSSPLIETKTMGNSMPSILLEAITKVGPILLFLIFLIISSYRADNVTDTDLDKDTNPYKHNYYGGYPYHHSFIKPGTRRPQAGTRLVC